ncbi:MAG: hypothetical protein AAGA48_12145 [Myxococcota bacterium]
MIPKTVPCRRGQYALVTALCAIPFLGVGALALDLSIASLAASESDAVAFAAAQTAIVAYAHGKSVEEAKALANHVVHNHPVRWGAGTFTITNLEWGWVDRKTGDLVTDMDAIEATKATIQRPTATMVFGSLFGVSDLTVHGVSISNQLASQFDRDDCDSKVGMKLAGDRRKFLLGRRPHQVATYELDPPNHSGWYAVYKDDVAESGAKQRNESSYFRLYNDQNPTGLPFNQNCGNEFVIQDYDNGGRVPDRVYIGTFYFDTQSPNTLEMRHYCAIVDECPQFLDLYADCGDSADSVHFDRGQGHLCLEAL